MMGKWAVCTALLWALVFSETRLAWGRRFAVILLRFPIWVPESGTGEVLFLTACYYRVLGARQVPGGFRVG